MHKNEVLVAKKCLDFCITLAVRTVVAFYELHVQISCFHRVEVAKDEEIVVINADKFLLI